MRITTYNHFHYVLDCAGPTLAPPPPLPPLLPLLLPLITTHYYYYAPGGQRYPSASSPARCAPPGAWYRALSCVK